MPVIHQLLGHIGHFGSSYFHLPDNYIRYRQKAKIPANLHPDPAPYLYGGRGIVISDNHVVALMPSSLEVLSEVNTTVLLNAHCEGICGFKVKCR